MTIDPVHILVSIFVAFLFGWFAAVSAVFLGGYLVFRTKRESHDPFMSLKGPQGDAVNVDDGLGAHAQQEEHNDIGGWESDEARNLMNDITNKFQQNIGQEYGKESNKEQT